MKNWSFTTLSLLFLASVLSFQACRKDSTEVEPDRIFGQYSLIYDQTTGQTTARARFTVGEENGVTVRLEGNATVSLNGQRLEYSGGSYTRTFQGTVDSVTFVFQDNLDRTFTNTLSGLLYIDLPGYLTSLTRGQSMEFLWLGESLLSPEVARLTVKNLEGSTREAVYVQTANGATSLFVDGTRLNELEPGNATATFEREILRQGQGTAVGAVTRTTYRTKRDVTIF